MDVATFAAKLIAAAGNPRKLSQLVNKDIRDLEVECKCWVVWNHSNKPGADHSFNKKYNISAFTTRKAAAKAAAEWNAREKKEYKEHPWWGPWETNGTDHKVEKRDKVCVSAFNFNFGG